MKHSARIWSILMALAILLSACAPATPAAAPTSVDVSIVVMDGEGKEFRLEAPAQRIISLAPSNTEILFAVGAGKQVIAREDFSNFPEDAAKLPSIGGNMGTYNLEEITRLQPDLILASPLTAPEALKSLLAITPNVFTVSNPRDLEGMYANLVIVGTLTGHKTEAEALTADLKTRAQAVLEKVKGVTEKPKVFYELDATDPAKPWTAGPGTFIDLLVGLAGGQNIGASLSGDWAQISQEELIVQNPDIILLGDALYGGITPESVAARPGWSGIAAVTGKHVMPINDDLISRPGPRMIDGLEALAKAIHPELFE
ncbi:MAG: cobalamin-binding protein [Anaerolineaceae bacterium]|nr:cobalamin-binding protein [Anaerolineaceae bacterium]